MDTLPIFSAADGLRIDRLSMDYPMCVLFGFAEEFFRRDQIINETSNRFIGRVAEDPRKLRVNPQYAIFYIEKNDTLRRLFKQLIELRLLCSQLLSASQQGRLRLLALSDVRHRAHELEATPLIRGRMTDYAHIFDTAIG